MSAHVCELHLIGKCRYGRKCLYAHAKVPMELTLMASRLELTVLVQRAWPRREQAALTAWTLMQALLRRLKTSDSLDLLVYDSEVMRAADFQPQIEHGKISELRPAFVLPHERFGPDRFFEPLAQVIAALCAASQRRDSSAAPVARQLVVFTHTGAVADYCNTDAFSQLAPLMRAAHLRVVVIGVDLSDDARQSLSRVCDNNDLFAFVDGKPGLSSCCDLNRVSARAHGATVLAAYHALGAPANTYGPCDRPPKSEYYRARAQLFIPAPQPQASCN
jgi:hypothetical protein